MILGEAKQDNVARGSTSLRRGERVARGQPTVNEEYLATAVAAMSSYKHHGKPCAQNSPDDSRGWGERGKDHKVLREGGGSQGAKGRRWVTKGKRSGGRVTRS